MAVSGLTLDMRADNPCDRVVPVLGPQNDIVTHRQALPHKDVAAAMPKMLQYHKVAAVAHGFRSSFRDWAAEMTDHPREVIETALAHVAQNNVEAAYARSDLFERRRRLMDDWAEYFGDAHRPVA